MQAEDAVTVGVGLLHHVAELAVGEGVPHLSHLSGELGGGDVAAAVAVEGAEELNDLVLVEKHLLVDVGEDCADDLVEFD